MKPDTWKNWDWGGRKQLYYLPISSFFIGPISKALLQCQIIATGLFKNQFDMCVVLKFFFTQLKLSTKCGQLERYRFEMSYYRRKDLLPQNGTERHEREGKTSLKETGLGKKSSPQEHKLPHLPQLEPLEMAVLQSEKTSLRRFLQNKLWLTLKQSIHFPFFIPKTLVWLGLIGNPSRATLFCNF